MTKTLANGRGAASATSTDSRQLALPLGPRESARHAAKAIARRRREDGIKTYAAVQKMRAAGYRVHKADEPGFHVVRWEDRVAVLQTRDLKMIAKRLQDRRVDRALGVIR